MVEDGGITLVDLFWHILQRGCGDVWENDWPVALAGPAPQALGTDRSGRSVPPPSGRWTGPGVRFAAGGKAWRSLNSDG